MDKQILDRIKKSEQRVVDLYGKVRDLNTTVYGNGGTQGLKDQYTILQIDPDLEVYNDNTWPAKARGKALKDLYQKLKDKDSFSGDYRHTILVPPGEYYFEDGEPLVLDYEGIDLVSLTGEPDVFLWVDTPNDPFGIDAITYAGGGTPQDLEDNFSFSDVGDNVYGQNYGVDSEGIFFREVDQGDNEDGLKESYPVRFGLVNTGSDSLYYSIDFIQEDNCSDLGFAMWQEGSTPNWNWGAGHFGTIFKVQFNCENKLEIVGFDDYDEMIIPGGLITGHTYSLYINMISITGSLFIGLYDRTANNWVLSNNYTGDYPIPAGYNIFAGIAADADGSSSIHIPYLYGPNGMYTTFSPCISVESSYVTVRGMVGANPDSSNWYNWAEPDNYDYNHPIFVNPELTEVLIENCIGGPFSFGSDPFNNTNGIYNNGYKFINCKAPQGYSFGYGVQEYSVTVTGCDSFDRYNNLSPYCSYLGEEGGLFSIYKDCTFGRNSFSADEIEIDAVNCIAGNDSFRGYSYLDGIFENCRAGNYSFRADGGNIYGIYRNCIVDGYSIFYADSNVYANFYNCWFGDVWSLNGTQANCYYCYNAQSDGEPVPTVNYAYYCINITD